LPVDSLAAVADQLLGDDRVHRAGGVADALDQAVALADDPDRPPALVLVAGSVVLAADARRALGVEDRR
jgi:dihydrofolate synthase/folylpolyglutamate synthase